MSDALKKAEEIVQAAKDGRNDRYKSTDAIEDFLFCIGVIPTHPSLNNRPDSNRPDLQEIYDEAWDEEN